jgi:hypothetical protein
MSTEKKPSSAAEHNEGGVYFSIVRPVTDMCREVCEALLDVSAEFLLYFLLMTQCCKETKPVIFLDMSPIKHPFVLVLPEPMSSSWLLFRLQRVARKIFT